MRIRMNETLATPTTTYKLGMEYDFEDAEAGRLIAAGIASTVGTVPPGTPLEPQQQQPAAAPLRSTMDALPSTPVESVAVPSATGEPQTPARQAAHIAADPAAGEAEMFGRPLHTYAAMSDDEIIAPPGIGNAKLRQIREAIAARDDATTGKTAAVADAVPVTTGVGTEQPSQTAPAPVNN